jgi:hypothetical protein
VGCGCCGNYNEFSVSGRRGALKGSTVQRAISSLVGRAGELTAVENCSALAWAVSYRPGQQARLRLGSPTMLDKAGSLGTHLEYAIGLETRGSEAGKRGR